jgi:hypothetical protein
MSAPHDMEFNVTFLSAPYEMRLLDNKKIMVRNVFFSTCPYPIQIYQDIHGCWVLEEVMMNASLVVQWMLWGPDGDEDTAMTVAECYDYLKEVVQNFVAYQMEDIEMPKATS